MAQRSGRRARAARRRRCEAVETAPARGEWTEYQAREARAPELVRSRGPSPRFPRSRFPGGFRFASGGGRCEKVERPPRFPPTRARGGTRAKGQEGGSEGGSERGKLVLGQARVCAWARGRAGVVGARLARARRRRVRARSGAWARASVGACESARGAHRYIKRTEGRKGKSCKRKGAKKRREYE